VGLVGRFFDVDGVGVAVWGPDVHGVDAVDVFLVEAAFADGQLLFFLRLEMFCEDFAGQEGVTGDFLGHVKDAPEDEGEEGEAAYDGDGDVTGGGAFDYEGLMNCGLSAGGRISPRRRTGLSFGMALAEISDCGIFRRVQVKVKV